MKKSLIAVCLTIFCLSLFSITVFAAVSENDPAEPFFSDTFEKSTVSAASSGAQGQYTQSYENVVFDVGNLIPGSCSQESWTITNDTSFPCYLDLERISVTNHENGLLEPEVEAGDSTADVGELSDVIHIDLFIDNDQNGFCDADDLMVYSGLVSGLAGSYDLNALVSKGSDAHVVADFVWSDALCANQAMGDDMQMSVTFELAQTAGQ